MKPRKQTISLSFHMNPQHQVYDIWVDANLTLVAKMYMYMPREIRNLVSQLAHDWLGEHNYDL